MARRRDESEIRWVRTRQAIDTATVTGSVTEVSDWHAVVPDIQTPMWPGVVCNTQLRGAAQWESIESVKGREGSRCATCKAAVDAWCEEFLQPDR